MGLRRSYQLQKQKRNQSNLQKQKRNQSNLDAFQKESVSKNEKIKQKENTVIVIPTSKSSSQFKETQALSKLRGQLTMPLAANLTSLSCCKQAPLAEIVVLKSQLSVSGVLKEDNRHMPTPSTSSDHRAKQNSIVRSTTLIKDDSQLPKGKSIDEQVRGKLERNGLLERRNKSLTFEDALSSGLDNICAAFDCRSNKPSTSKDRTAADKKFTTDGNGIQLSSDILDIILNSFISKLTLNELLFLYWVNHTDNFDDFDI